MSSTPWRAPTGTGPRSVPSLNEMVEETLGLLNDWTGLQPQLCSLTAPMTTDSLTVVVDAGEKLSQGLIEVGEELIHVASFSAANGNATVPPWGRAQQGSTAAVHAVGDRVTIAPRPPRDRIRKRIAQEIQALYPDLWAVSSTEHTSAVRAEYGMPAGARWIVDIQWETPSPEMEWARVRGWRLNTEADPGDFPTGRSVTIPGVPSGYTIRVVWAGEPQPLTAGTDDFAAVTGFHVGVADIVTMSAAAHIVLGQELSRGQLATVEQSQRTDKVSTGASLAASRFLRQERALRIASERRRLLANHPSRPHFEGA